LKALLTRLTNENVVIDELEKSIKRAKVMERTINSQQTKMKATNHNKTKRREL
jgi:hypothetical protein